MKSIPIDDLLLAFILLPVYIEKERIQFVDCDDLLIEMNHLLFFFFKKKKKTKKKNRCSF